jgi:hypothetical protein
MESSYVTNSAATVGDAEGEEAATGRPKPTAARERRSNPFITGPSWIR